MNKIQIRLWDECGNNCTFCSLGTKHKISQESKKKRIQYLTTLTNDTIGIIGGEFFSGQLYKCEDEWLNAITQLRDRNLMITANLICKDQYLLNETLKIKPDILICTSYDTVGRFHDDNSKNIWLANVNSLPNIFCTIIPTQDAIEDSFIKQISCKKNICEPFLGISWYNNIRKDKYHELLIQDNKLFNLPKRNDFLSWVQNYPDIIANIKNYKNNHFSTIVSFTEDDEPCYESNDRFSSKEFIADCGHPYFSRCYTDSDKCLQCDVNELF